MGITVQHYQFKYTKLTSNDSKQLSLIERDC